jgi:hypothetical protein
MTLVPKRRGRHKFQDNHHPSFAQGQTSPRERALLLNLAATWNPSPILNPVLRAATDILDLAEVA